MLNGYEVKKILTCDPHDFNTLKNEYGDLGGQMFKEAEKGTKEVFIERTEEALETGWDIIATACPFCMTMMNDGIKYKNKEETVKNYDIAELVSIGLGLS